MAIEWTDTMRMELARIVDENKKGTRISWITVSDIMSRLFNEEFTRSSVKMQYQNYIQGTREKKIEMPVLREKEVYAEQLEFKNGQWQSDKLIAMSAEQEKDADFLLSAHGFDPGKWELVSAKSSLWHQRNKKDQFNQTDKPVLLYSNKITAKPKVTGINWEQIIANINDASEPLFITSDYVMEDGEKHLAVMLNDMHFGISTYDDYIETQQEIVNLLENGYKNILFVLGSDMFHHNDLRNRTVSGREIEHVDMTTAWQYAADFYEPILQWAVKKTEGVECVYIPGNHDESLGWAFTKYLEGRFPQVYFDTAFDHRKVTMLGNNMIGMAHGDKSVKDLPMLMATEFPKEWAAASTRECFIGHLHTEKTTLIQSEDVQGITIRRTPTRNIIDKWHKEYGYTMAHKRFMCVEYSRDEVKAQYYI